MTKLGKFSSASIGFPFVAPDQTRFGYAFPGEDDVRTHEAINRVEINRDVVRQFKQILGHGARGRLGGEVGLTAPQVGFPVS